MMTTDERFERIERNLVASTETLDVLANAQVRTDQTLKAILAPQSNLQETLGTLLQSIAGYVDAAEHSNGKH